MYKIAKTRLIVEDDINEAVQNAIVNAYVSIKKLKNPKYFKTWIIKILINECNYVYKSRKVFEEYDENKIKQISKDYINDAIHNIDFFELIKFLKNDEKIVITLFYCEDLTISEISKIINMPKNTVSTKLSRARKKLKNILEGGELYE